MPLILDSKSLAEAESLTISMVVIGATVATATLQGATVAMGRSPGRGEGPAKG